MGRAHLLSVGLVAALAAALALLTPSHSTFVGVTAAGGSGFSTAASYGTVLYLHADPWPPAADSASQAVLPFEGTAPTVGTLFNYDTDRDAAPGLVIAKGSGLSDPDPTKSQTWRHVPASTLALSGAAVLTLWTAMKDFTAGKLGHVAVGVYDCNTAGASCTAIGIASRTMTWPSSFQPVTFSLGTWSTSIATTRSLVLKVAVWTNAQDDLWFAYDTTAYPSRLTVG